MYYNLSMRKFILNAYGKHRRPKLSVTTIWFSDVCKSLRHSVQVPETQRETFTKGG